MECNHRGNIGEFSSDSADWVHSSNKEGYGRDLKLIISWKSNIFCKNDNYRVFLIHRLELSSRVVVADKIIDQAFDRPLKVVEILAATHMQFPRDLVYLTFFHIGKLQNAMAALVAG
jgi:hypothetical protein